MLRLLLTPVVLVGPTINAFGQSSASAIATTTSGGVTLLADAGTVTAADLTVAGEVDYTYDITVPTSHIIISSAGTETITLDAFTSDPDAAAGVLIITLGTDTLYVGAKLNVLLYK